MKMDYFLKLSGAVLLGVLAIIIAALVFSVLFLFIFPNILAIVNVFIAMLIFIILWAVVCVSMLIGITIYYLFKPMKVSKRGDYKIRMAKEAGRRKKRQ